MTNPLKIGLASLCLLLLPACSSTPTYQPLNTVSSCPQVTPCRLTAQPKPQTNADLLDAVMAAQADWHFCAAQVDMIVACQGRP